MSDDTKFCYLSSLWCERWTQVNGTLHDTLGKVRIGLALPRAVLQTATENGASTDSSLHHIGSVFTAIISATDSQHDAWLVPNEHNLAASWVHVRVHDSAELGGEKTSAVYNHIGMARRVKASGFGDVGEDAAFDDDAGFYTLAEDPGQVDGSVDADGRELCAGVTVFRELVFGQDTELTVISPVLPGYQKTKNNIHWAPRP